MHARTRTGQQRRLRRRLRVRPAWRIAAIGLACAACGLVGSALSQSPPHFRAAAPSDPEFVEEAVMSRRASLVRAAMVSQPETTRLDAAEIRKAVNLRLPALPPGWRVLDVQVYPTDVGPGVSLAVETAEGRRLSLFAVRAETAAGATPILTSKDGEAVAYWEVGDAAYALTGDAPQAVVAAGAALLSRSKLL